MKFVTEIPINTVSKGNLITYESQIAMLGSCFTENIGDRFKFYKFRTSVNPFGIMFNPKAIESFVKRAVLSQFVSEDDLIYHNERYHCFDAHSDFSHSSKEYTVQQLNLNLTNFKHQLPIFTHVILTLGTAWCYKNKKTNSFVANCHKVPQSEFDKVLLSTNEIKSSLKQIVSLLKSVNPNLKVIFTVSPVRHLKDGFINNTISKSHIISSIHEICQEYRELNYFPSFEIMMDELRDYRFYKQDMIHPNAIAIDYIWDKFKSYWVSDEAQELMNTIAQIQKGLAHKPFNPDSQAHRKFKETIDHKIDGVKKRYNFIEF